MVPQGRALAASVLMFNLHIVATAGVVFCENSMACVDLPGHTCKNERCVCEPGHTGLFPCSGSPYGDKCRTNEDCSAFDPNMECSRAEYLTCRCLRGLLWDEESKRCYTLDDNTYYTRTFDAVRDLIIPGIIVMTVAAMVYLGIKFFCNCGKLWRRRRRRPELPRDLEDAHAQPATWVASYRVFSSLNGVEPRAPPALSPSQQFPLHPTPCMGLFLPAGSLGPPAAAAAAVAASPPSYEESLKHKVIMSSYPLTVVLPPASSPPPTLTVPPPLNLGGGSPSASGPPN